MRVRYSQAFQQVHGGQMDLNRKYFGMTIAQIGILAGLAGLAFLLFCITGWMIIGRRLRPSQAQPLPSIAMAQSTATLIMTPTQTSTPAPTPVPYETLIPNNWTQYRT